MKFIQPGNIRGRINAPASKSVLQRALIAASLARGRSEIRCAGQWCDDTRSALRVVEALWTRSENIDGGIAIFGKVHAPPAEISCGESGLCFRMSCAVAALADTAVLIQGEGSLLTRPMSMIEDALVSLGARCLTNEGLPPVSVHGPLRGGEAVIDGSTSSQFLTGLLFALPVCGCDSRLIVRNLKSKPYIDLTVDVLSAFGIRIERADDYSSFVIPGRQQYQPVTFTVEGDWSGASCLLVAGAIGGGIEIEGLNSASTQADRAVVSALELAGAGVTAEANVIRVSSGALRAFEFDATDCPDLFPALAALAAVCPGTSRITGTHRLLHKESNRLQTLCDELTKLGVCIAARGDTLEIEGGKISGGTIGSHGDHRIAMAGAVLGLVSQSGVHIDGETAVSKSYPGFFDDLAILTGEGA